MDIVTYVYNKFDENYPEGVPKWKHLLNIVYGYSHHHTRLAVATHITIIYGVICMFFDGKIIHYGQVILACMLLHEIWIFIKTEDAIEDFKKL